MQNKHMEKLRIAIVGKVLIPQKDSCVTQTKIK